MKEKNFDGWNEVKKEVDNQEAKKYPSYGKIYWCNVGMNIGREVYGKGGKFIRPVLVLNVFPNDTFLGVPLSSQTKNKTGFMFYKFVDSKQKTQIALLGQIRIFDSKRISDFVSSVNSEILKQIKDKIRKGILR